MPLAKKVHWRQEKERGREIRPGIGQIAKKSYQNALQIEKKEWFNDRLNSQDNEETESVGIGASCDMGWERIGKGHNSVTGEYFRFPKLIPVQNGVNLSSLLLLAVLNNKGL